MNIWLHRISHHAELAYPLLEKGLLSIGYSDFSNPQFLEDCSKENRDELFEQQVKKTWGENQRTRFNLWRFIAEMKKGDLIVVPTTGAFGVYELTEDSATTINEIDMTNLKDWHGNTIQKKDDGCLYSLKEEKIDLGFVRKVKLIQKDILRYEYADAALTARLKIQSTNSNITDLKYSVDKAITSFIKREPLNIYAQIIETTQKSILATINKELTPDKFERVVKWYFQRIGASLVDIPAKNEPNKKGDADVVAVFEPLKIIIYVQVKFHNHYTDAWSIQQIKEYKEHKDAMDDGYSKIGWVITSADGFSVDAQQYAKEAQVQLVDGKQFTKMLLDAGMENLGKAF